MAGLRPGLGLGGTIHSLLVRDAVGDPALTAVEAVASIGFIYNDGLVTVMGADAGAGAGARIGGDAADTGVEPEGDAAINVTVSLMLVWSDSQ